MPGSGFKDWTTGDVVTADQFDGYVQKQVVMYFADATARDAAIASPEEGMHAYLADRNVTVLYDGLEWILAGGGAVRVDSAAPLYRRPRVNLIAGTNISISAADDAANDEVDVTITGVTALHIEAKNSTSASGAVSVTWTTAFAGTPVVVVTPFNATAATLSAAHVTSRSTTGATTWHSDTLVRMVMATEAS